MWREREGEKSLRGGKTGALSERIRDTKERGGAEHPPFIVGEAYVALAR